MARKHIKKKKPVQPAPSEQISISDQPVQPSPEMVEVLKKIEQGGPGYLMERFIDVMEESYDLADEIEFQDLYFDKEKTIRTSKRWLSRFQKRLDEASKVSQEKLKEVQDEMRIKIINELVTPDFRKNVMRRLTNLINRLAVSKKPKELEIAIMLEPILKIKQIPWGICGLILNIFERTVRSTIEPFDEEEVFGAELIEYLESEGIDITDIDKLDPHIFDHLENKLDVNSDFYKKLEEKAEQLIEEFENEVFYGRIKLELFSKEEIKQIDRHLSDTFSRFNIPDSSQDEEEKITLFYQTVKQYLINLMTPERLNKICIDLKKTVEQWKKRRNEWAGVLHTELDMLESSRDEGMDIREIIEYNPLILRVLITQVLKDSSFINIENEAGKRR